MKLRATVFHKHKFDGSYFVDLLDFQHKINWNYEAIYEANMFLIPQELNNYISGKLISKDYYNVLFNKYGRYKKYKVRS